MKDDSARFGCGVNFATWCSGLFLFLIIHLSSIFSRIYPRRDCFLPHTPRQVFADNSETVDGDNTFLITYDCGNSPLIVGGSSSCRIQLAIADCETNPPALGLTTTTIRLPFFSWSLDLSSSSIRNQLEYEGAALLPTHYAIVKESIAIQSSLLPDKTALTTLYKFTPMLLILPTVVTLNCNTPFVVSVPLTTLEYGNYPSHSNFQTTFGITKMIIRGSYPYIAPRPVPMVSSSLSMYSIPYLHAFSAVSFSASNAPYPISAGSILTLRAHRGRILSPNELSTPENEGFTLFSKIQSTAVPMGGILTTQFLDSDTVVLTMDSLPLTFDLTDGVYQTGPRFRWTDVLPVQLSSIPGRVQLLTNETYVMPVDSMYSIHNGVTVNVMNLRDFTLGSKNISLNIGVHLPTLFTYYELIFDLPTGSKLSVVSTPIITILTSLGVNVLSTTFPKITCFTSTNTSTISVPNTVIDVISRVTCAFEISKPLYQVDLAFSLQIDLPRSLSSRNSPTTAALLLPRQPLFSPFSLFFGPKKAAFQLDNAYFETSSGADLGLSRTTLFSRPYPSTTFPFYTSQFCSFPSSNGGSIGAEYVASNTPKIYGDVAEAWIFSLCLTQPLEAGDVIEFRFLHAFVELQSSPSFLLELGIFASLPSSDIPVSTSQFVCEGRTELSVDVENVFEAEVMDDTIVTCTATTTVNLDGVPDWSNSSRLYFSLTGVSAPSHPTREKKSLGKASSHTVQVALFRLTKHEIEGETQVQNELTVAHVDSIPVPRFVPATLEFSVMTSHLSLSSSLLSTTSPDSALLRMYERNVKELGPTHRILGFPFVLSWVTSHWIGGVVTGASILLYLPIGTQGYSSVSNVDDDNVVILRSNIVSLQGVCSTVHPVDITNSSNSPYLSYFKPNKSFLHCVVTSVPSSMVEYKGKPVYFSVDVVVPHPRSLVHSAHLSLSTFGRSYRKTTTDFPSFSSSSSSSKEQEEFIGRHSFALWSSAQLVITYAFSKDTMLSKYSSNYNPSINTSVNTEFEIPVATSIADEYDLASVSLPISLPSFFSADSNDGVVVVQWEGGKRSTRLFFSPEFTPGTNPTLSSTFTSTFTSTSTSTSSSSSSSPSNLRGSPSMPYFSQPRGVRKTPFSTSDMKSGSGNVPMLNDDYHVLSGSYPFCKQDDHDNGENTTSHCRFFPDSFLRFPTSVSGPEDVSLSTSLLQTQNPVFTHTGYEDGLSVAILPFWSQFVGNEGKKGEEEANSSGDIISLGKHAGFGPRLFFTFGAPHTTSMANPTRLQCVRCDTTTSSPPASPSSPLCDYSECGNENIGTHSSSSEPTFESASGTSLSPFWFFRKTPFVAESTGFFHTLLLENIPVIFKTDLEENANTTATTTSDWNSFRFYQRRLLQCPSEIRPFPDLFSFSDSIDKTTPTSTTDSLVFTSSGVDGFELITPLSPFPLSTSASSSSSSSSSPFLSPDAMYTGEYWSSTDNYGFSSIGHFCRNATVSTKLQCLSTDDVFSSTTHLAHSSFFPFSSLSATNTKNITNNATGFSFTSGSTLLHIIVSSRVEENRFPTSLLRSRIDNVGFGVRLWNISARKGYVPSTILHMSTDRMMANPRNQGLLNEENISLRSPLRRVQLYSYVVNNKIENKEDKDEDEDNTTTSSPSHLALFENIDAEAAHSIQFLSNLHDKHCHSFLHCGACTAHKEAGCRWIPSSSSCLHEDTLTWNEQQDELFSTTTCGCGTRTTKEECLAHEGCGYCAFSLSSLSSTPASFALNITSSSDTTSKVCFEADRKSSHQVYQSKCLLVLQPSSTVLSSTLTEGIDDIDGINEYSIQDTTGFVTSFPLPSSSTHFPYYGMETTQSTETTEESNMNMVLLGTSIDEFNWIRHALSLLGLENGSYNSLSIARKFPGYISSISQPFKFVPRSILRLPPGESSTIPPQYVAHLVYAPSFTSERWGNEFPSASHISTTPLFFASRDEVSGNMVGWLYYSTSSIPGFGSNFITKTNIAHTITESSSTATLLWPSPLSLPLKTSHIEVLPALPVLPSFSLSPRLSLLVGAFSGTKYVLKHLSQQAIPLSNYLFKINLRPYETKGMITVAVRYSSPSLSGTSSSHPAFYQFEWVTDASKCSSTSASGSTSTNIPSFESSTETCKECTRYAMTGLITSSTPIDCTCLSTVADRGYRRLVRYGKDGSRTVLAYDLDSSFAPYGSYTIIIQVHEEINQQSEAQTVIRVYISSAGSLSPGNKLVFSIRDRSPVRPLVGTVAVGSAGGLASTLAFTHPEIHFYVFERFWDTSLAISREIASKPSPQGLFRLTTRESRSSSSDETGTTPNANSLPLLRFLAREHIFTDPTTEPSSENISVARHVNIAMLQSCPSAVSTELRENAVTAVISIPHSAYSKVGKNSSGSVEDPERIEISLSSSLAHRGTETISGSIRKYTSLLHASSSTHVSPSLTTEQLSRIAKFGLSVGITVPKCYFSASSTTTPTQNEDVATGFMPLVTISTQHVRDTSGKVKTHQRTIPIHPSLWECTEQKSLFAFLPSSRFSQSFADYDLGFSTETLTGTTGVGKETLGFSPVVSTCTSLSSACYRLGMDTSKGIYVSHGTEVDINTTYSVPTHYPFVWSTNTTLPKRPLEDVSFSLERLFCRAFLPPSNLSGFFGAFSTIPFTSQEGSSGFTSISAAQGLPIRSSLVSLSTSSLLHKALERMGSNEENTDVVPPFASISVLPPLPSSLSQSFPPGISLPRSPFIAFGNTVASDDILIAIHASESEGLYSTSLLRLYTGQFEYDKDKNAMPAPLPVPPYIYRHTTSFPLAAPQLDRSSVARSLSFLGTSHSYAILRFSGLFALTNKLSLTIHLPRSFVVKEMTLGTFQCSLALAKTLHVDTSVSFQNLPLLPNLASFRLRSEGSLTRKISQLATTSSSSGTGKVEISSFFQNVEFSLRGPFRYDDESNPKKDYHDPTLAFPESTDDNTGESEENISSDRMEYFSFETSEFLLPSLQDEFEVILQCSKANGFHTTPISDFLQDPKTSIDDTSSSFSISHESAFRALPVNVFVRGGSPSVFSYTTTSNSTSSLGGYLMTVTGENFFLPSALTSVIFLRRSFIFSSSNNEEISEDWSIDWPVDGPFYATPAIILSWTPSKIILTVPPGVGLQSIQITRRDGQQVSFPFSYTTPVLLSFAQEMGNSGDTSASHSTFATGRLPLPPYIWSRIPSPHPTGSPYDDSTVRFTGRGFGSDPSLVSVFVVGYVISSTIDFIELERELEIYREEMKRIGGSFNTQNLELQRQHTLQKVRRRCVIISLSSPTSPTTGSSLQTVYCRLPAGYVGFPGQPPVLSVSVVVAGQFTKNSTIISSTIPMTLSVTLSGPAVVSISPVEGLSSTTTPITVVGNSLGFGYAYLGSELSVDGWFCVPPETNYALPKNVGCLRLSGTNALVPSLSLEHFHGFLLHHDLGPVAELRVRANDTTKPSLSTVLANTTLRALRQGCTLFSFRKVSSEIHAFCSDHRTIQYASESGDECSPASTEYTVEGALFVSESYTPSSSPIPFLSEFVYAPLGNFFSHRQCMVPSAGALVSYSSRLLSNALKIKDRGNTEYIGPSTLGVPLFAPFSYIAPVITTFSPTQGKSTQGYLIISAEKVHYQPPTTLQTWSILLRSQLVSSFITTCEIDLTRTTDGVGCTYANLIPDMLYHVVVSYNDVEMIPQSSSSSPSTSPMRFLYTTTPPSFSTNFLGEIPTIGGELEVMGSGLVTSNTVYVKSSWAEGDVLIEQYDITRRGFSSLIQTSALSTKTIRMKAKVQENEVEMDGKVVFMLQPIKRVYSTGKDIPVRINFLPLQIPSFGIISTLRYSFLRPHITSVSILTEAKGEVSNTPLLINHNDISLYTSFSSPSLPSSFSAIILVLRGTNFGLAKQTANDDDVVIRLSQSSSSEFSMYLVCVVTIDHIEIHCVLPPFRGLGTGWEPTIVTQYHRSAHTQLSTLAEGISLSFTFLKNDVSTPPSLTFFAPALSLSIDNLSEAWVPRALTLSFASFPLPFVHLQSLDHVLRRVISLVPVSTAIHLSTKLLFTSAALSTIHSLQSSYSPFSGKSSLELEFSATIGPYTAKIHSISSSSVSLELPIGALGGDFPITLLYHGAIVYSSDVVQLYSTQATALGVAPLSVTLPPPTLLGVTSGGPTSTRLLPDTYVSLLGHGFLSAFQSVLYPSSDVDWSMVNTRMRSFIMYYHLPSLLQKDERCSDSERKNVLYGGLISGPDPFFSIPTPTVLTLHCGFVSAYEITPEDPQPVLTTPTELHLFRIDVKTPSLPTLQLALQAMRQHEDENRGENRDENTDESNISSLVTSLAFAYCLRDGEMEQGRGLLCSPLSTSVNESRGNRLPPYTLLDMDLDVETNRVSGGSLSQQLPLSSVLSEIPMETLNDSTNINDIVRIVGIASSHCVLSITATQYEDYGVIPFYDENGIDISMIEKDSTQSNEGLLYGPNSSILTSLVSPVTYLCSRGDTDTQQETVDDTMDWDSRSHVFSKGEMESDPNLADLESLFGYTKRTAVKENSGKLTSNSNASQIPSSTSPTTFIVDVILQHAPFYPSETVALYIGSHPCEISILTPPTISSPTNSIVRCILRSPIFTLLTLADLRVFSTTFPSFPFTFPSSSAVRISVDSCPPGFVLRPDDGSCYPCPSGSFSAKTKSPDSIASLRCTLCPIGTFSSSPGSSTCSLCPAGSVSTRVGSSQCLSCGLLPIPNTYAPSPGLAKCVPCPSGSIAWNDNADCVPCSPGQFVSLSTPFTITPSLKCVDCPAGRFTEPTVAAAGPDEFSCIPSPKGTYFPFSGTALHALSNHDQSQDSLSSIGMPIPCPSGRFAAEEGMSECTLCPPNTYAPSSSAILCLPCSEGTSTGELSGQSSCEVCPVNTYGTFAGETLNSPFSLRQACTTCHPSQFLPVSSSPATRLKCVFCPEGYVAREETDVTEESNENPILQHCRVCSPGTFASATETLGMVCNLCEPGTYSSSSGATTCSNCSLGLVSQLPGAQICEMCPAGTSSISYTFSTTISLHPPTSFEDIFVAIEEYATTTTFHRASREECYPCPAGHFGSITRTLVSPLCQPCEIGTYALPGSSECLPCPPGTVGVALDTLDSTIPMVSCRVTSPGFFAPTAGLVTEIPCPAGFYSSSIINSIAGIGTQFCLECSDNEWSDIGSSTCTACKMVPGTNQVVTTSTPSSTPSLPSMISQTEYFQCLSPCPAGTHMNSLTWLCEPCAEGYSSTQFTYTIPADYQGKPEDYIYSVSDIVSSDVIAGNCYICPAGMFSPSLGSISCSTCQTGTFSSILGASTCEGCPLNTYASKIGSKLCRDCPVNYYSSIRSSSCSLCQGTIDNVACESCQPGYYRRSSLSNAGEEFNASNTSPGYTYARGYVCMPCDEGKYSTGHTATTCITCPAGTSGHGLFGASSCFTCNIGTFHDGDKPTDPCQDCPLGTFAEVAMSKQCTSCSAGSFTSLKGKEICTLCTAGRYTEPGVRNSNRTIPSLLDDESNNDEEPPMSLIVTSTNWYALGFNGPTSCTDCPAGTYIPIPGSGAYTPCPAGSYSPTPASTTCYQCPQGRYSPEIASTTCFLCPPATSALPGSSLCLPCSPGSFGTETSREASIIDQVFSDAFPDLKNPQTGAISSWVVEGMVQYPSCPECPRGWFQNSQAASSCEACSPGKTTASIGASQCDICSFNQYTPKSGSPECEFCLSDMIGNVERTACVCPAGTYSVLKPEYASSTQFETMQLFTTEASIITFTQNAMENNMDLDVSYPLIQPYVDCIACPVGGVCDAPGISRFELDTLPGFWRVNTSSLDFYRCLIPDQCKGGIGVGVCDPNRQGELCEFCVEGFYENNLLCLECPTKTYYIVRAVFIALAILITITLFVWMVVTNDDEIIQRIFRLGAIRYNLRQNQDEWESHRGVERSEVLPGKVGGIQGEQNQGYRSSSRDHIRNSTSSTHSPLSLDLGSFMSGKHGEIELTTQREVLVSALPNSPRSSNSLSSPNSPHAPNSSSHLSPTISVSSSSPSTPSDRSSFINDTNRFDIMRIHQQRAILSSHDSSHRLSFFEHNNGRVQFATGMEDLGDEEEDQSEEDQSEEDDEEQKESNERSNVLSASPRPSFSISKNPSSKNDNISHTRSSKPGSASNSTVNSFSDAHQHMRVFDRVKSQAIIDLGLSKVEAKASTNSTPVEQTRTLNNEETLASEKSIPSFIAPCDGLPSNLSELSLIVPTPISSPISASNDTEYFENGLQKDPLISKPAYSIESSVASNPSYISRTPLTPQEVLLLDEYNTNSGSFILAKAQVSNFDPTALTTAVFAHAQNSSLTSFNFYLKIFLICLQLGFLTTSFSHIPLPYTLRRVFRLFHVFNMNIIQWLAVDCFYIPFAGNGSNSTSASDSIPFYTMFWITFVFILVCTAFSVIIYASFAMVYHNVLPRNMDSVLGGLCCGIVRKQGHNSRNNQLQAQKSSLKQLRKLYRNEVITESQYLAYNEQLSLNMPEEERVSTAWTIIAANCVKILAISQFLFFPRLIQLCAIFFNCTKIEGKWFMTSYFETTCFDDQWKQFVPIAVIVICLLCALPLTILFWISRAAKETRQRRIRKQHKMLGNSHIATESTKVIENARSSYIMTNEGVPDEYAGLFDPINLLRFGMFYQGYVSHCWWFDGIDFGVKFILAFGAFFVPPLWQLPVICAMLTLYVVLVLRLHPFIRKVDDVMFLAGVTTMAIIAYLSHNFNFLDNFSSSFLGFNYARGVSDTTRVALIVLVIYLLALVFGIFLRQAYLFVKQSRKNARTREMNNGLDQAAMDLLLVLYDQATRQQKLGGKSQESKKQKRSLQDENRQKQKRDSGVFDDNYPPPPPPLPDNDASFSEENEIEMMSSSNFRTRQKIVGKNHQGKISNSGHPKRYRQTLPVIVDDGEFAEEPEQASQDVITDNVMFIHDLIHGFADQESIFKDSIGDDNEEAPPPPPPEDNEIEALDSTSLNTDEVNKENVIPTEIVTIDDVDDNFVELSLTQQMKSSSSQTPRVSPLLITRSYTLSIPDVISTTKQSRQLSDTSTSRIDTRSPSYNTRTLLMSRYDHDETSANSLLNKLKKRPLTKSRIDSISSHNSTNDSLSHSSSGNTSENISTDTSKNVSRNPSQATTPTSRAFSRNPFSTNLITPIHTLSENEIVVQFNTNLSNRSHVISSHIELDSRLVEDIMDNDMKLSIPSHVVETQDGSTAGMDINAMNALYSQTNFESNTDIEADELVLTLPIPLVARQNQYNEYGDGLDTLSDSIDRMK